MAKDVVTTGRDVDTALSFAHDNGGGDAPDSALRDPAPDVKPSGTPHYKNAGRNGHQQGGILRSSLDAHTADRKNLRVKTLRAGPRATPLTQLTPLLAHAVARDNAGSARDDVRGHSRSPGNADSRTNVANDAPLPGNRHCNNALAGDPDETAARNP